MIICCEICKTSSYICIEVNDKHQDCPPNVKTQNTEYFELYRNSHIRCDVTPTSRIRALSILWRGITAKSPCVLLTYLFFLLAFLFFLFTILFFLLTSVLFLFTFLFFLFTFVSLLFIIVLFLIIFLFFLALHSFILLSYILISLAYCLYITRYIVIIICKSSPFLLKKISCCMLHDV